MEPALVSLLYYCFTLLICEILIRRILTIYISEEYWKYILEFAATLSGCLCVFENGAFRKYYGGNAYIAVASTVAFVNRSLKRGAYANPASLTEATVLGNLPILEYGIRLIVQLLGGMFAYRFAWLFWAFKLHDTHERRYISNYTCVTDLTVPLWEGFFYEFLATYVDQVIESYFVKYLSTNVARYSGGILCACITQLGLVYTGMYFNPILATTVTYGCSGLSTNEHLLIYWVGPIIGQISGTLTYRFLNRY